MEEQALTCSSCCQTCCNWQMQLKHQTQLLRSKISEWLHQSIPAEWQQGQFSHKDTAAEKKGRAFGKQPAFMPRGVWVSHGAWPWSGMASVEVVRGEQGMSSEQTHTHCCPAGLCSGTGTSEIPPSTKMIAGLFSWVTEIHFQQLLFQVSLECTTRNLKIVNGSKVIGHFLSHTELPLCDC